MNFPCPIQGQIAARKELSLECFGTGNASFVVTGYGRKRGFGAQVMASGGQLIVVVGLAFEARIAAGPGIRVICSGDGRDLAGALSSACIEGCRSVISFGVAGLGPGPSAGDLRGRLGDPVRDDPVGDGP
jgi:hypothetical protein